MSDDFSDEENPSSVVATSKPRLWKVLGPGLITGASDDDPSGIATYSQSGAQFGYGMAWTMVYSYPLMVAIQIVSARIGRVTGHGIAGVLARHYPKWLLNSAVLLLLIANVINLGADIGAMGDAARLLVKIPRWIYVLGFSGICIGLQVFLRYARYVAVLKWLAAALLAYFVSVAIVHIDWRALGLHALLPKVGWSHDGLTMLTAIFGTTISPYLFFWQSAEEAEDIRVYPHRDTLVAAPGQGQVALHRIGIDTAIGMGFSNLVALAIIVTTAATLHAHGVTNIATSAQAAQALQPLAGKFASTIFTVGIIGTGLLAVPVLAGSAAYAIGEARRWPTGLARRPKEAQAFYATLVVATLVGMILNFTPIDPIKALFWSAVVNGVTAVPLMVVMMLVVRRRDIMGDFTVHGALQIFGWLATIVMGAVVLLMLAQLF